MTKLTYFPADVVQVRLLAFNYIALVGGHLVFLPVRTHILKF